MNKKTKFLILLLAVIVMVLPVGAAKNPSELIGTITSLVETIQGYPAAINDAYCNGDLLDVRQKQSELAALISSANSAMADANLPNTLNLWAVYNAVSGNLSCGGIQTATGYADWSREELDRIGYRYGLFDTTIRSMPLVPTATQAPTQQLEPSLTPIPTQQPTATPIQIPTFIVPTIDPCAPGWGC